MSVELPSALKPRWVGLAAALAGLWALSASAQDLTPRSFWPAPVGAQILVCGYQYSRGDVLTDPSLPVYGVDSRINTGLLGYIRFFDLWGRTANVLLELPYSSGTTRGLIDDTTVRRDFAGLNDAGISVTINLVGAPALTRESFQALRADPRPIVGLEFKVVPPTGHYEADRLINVGGNRWAARLKLGSIIPLRPQWLLELAAGAWFFGDDDDFVAGKREQDPIYAVEAHLVRRFRPGFWGSLDANYFTGGRQTVGGSELSSLTDNARIGATLVIPFLGRNAAKIGYSTGTRTRSGSDFNQVVVSYQRLLQ